MHHCSFITCALDTTEILSIDVADHCLNDICHIAEARFCLI